MTKQFQHLPITAKTVRLLGMILIMFLFSSLTVRHAEAAPPHQTGCTLPATVTTATQLADCITAANTNGAGLDTITLGANITLSAALPQITTAIVVEGAGYFIDGADTYRIFYVISTGNFTINQVTLQNGNGTPGGAIYNLGALYVSNSTFANNVATGGGAIYNYYDNLSGFGTATISNSTFSGNNGGSAGGAINNTGDGGTVRVTNSTFSENVSDLGGAIYVNRGQVTATNNTFSGNSAATLGDATYSIGVGWRLYLAGNIIAGSASGDNCRSQGIPSIDPIDDNGYNLSDDATCTNGGTGSATNATLNLGPLADNGGSTQTHMPGSASSAINAIPNGTNVNNNGVTMACNGTTTDQIGNNRPIISGDDCTAGAVEVPPPCPIWTVTTSDELNDCIVRANGNESPSPTADTITLGANINLTSALPQITSEITVEGAGYAIDAGGSSRRVFNVGASGDLTVNQATLQNGSIVNGGAIFNAGTVTLTSSTLSGNAATNGGVVYNATAAMLTATNSTFSGNSASSSGGVIYNLGTFIATSNTFSGNSANTFGGSIYNLSTLRLAGNIFAAGSSVASCRFSGTQTDNGYNLSNDASCTNGGTGSMTNANLNLGVLADNGGDTLTHLPGAGSATIGVIPNATNIDNNGVTLACNGTTTDQIGSRRPINAGTACTAGAVEVAMPPLCTLPATVTTAVDLYNCILVANNNESPSPTADTITLGANINLTSILPQITSEITVEGAGFAIDGGGSVSLFNIGGAGDLTVNDATLQNGRSSGNGGAVVNNGTLTVNSSNISGNTTTFAGGAIHNAGTLRVNNSTISGNTANISSGGGISNSGPLTVINSTFSGNSTPGSGGAISNNNIPLTVINSTFSGNSASSGGAISNFQDSLTVTNSTFSGNSASNGGAIFGQYALSILNLAGNIFEKGTNGDNCVNSGPLNDNGYNLSDDGTCTNGGTGSVINAALNLGTLADNGGPTLTHALLAGSAAFDTIPAGACSLSADQRDVARPVNGSCDSGAYEGGTLVCSVSADNTYTFPQQSGVAIHVVSTTDLGCLYVEEMPLSHPNATGAGEGQALRTGKYWRIRALQDASGTTANSYVANLTLPHDNLNYPKACKYTGGAGYGWECAADASTSSTVTRNGLTSFSDWAVGSDVGPTAVSLQSLAVTSNRQAGVWLVVLVVGLVTAVGLWRRRTGQSS